jgi:hypothetical protein
LRYGARRGIATITGLTVAAGLTAGAGFLLGGQMPVVIEEPAASPPRTVTREVTVTVHAPRRTAE